MTCGFEHSDGAYVLGALSASQRLEFERHLEQCPGCTGRVRQLAGLPGLLGRVGPEVLDEPGAPPLPDTVLPALTSAVRRSQRHRTWVTAGSAAAAAALVVGLGATVLSLGDHQPTPPSSSADASPNPSPSPSPSPSPDAVPSLPMKPVGEVPVRASLTLEPVTWGTRIGLACTYDPTGVTYELPASVTYVLVVRTRAGETERVGTWKSVGGRTMHLEAATATGREDITSVEVRTTDGRVVLTAKA